MNYDVRSFLIELARTNKGQTTTYQKLSDACKLKLDMQNPDHRNKIAGLLEEISLHEHNNDPNRPLLSSLVLRASDGMEGDGFFKMAEELDFGEWRKLKNSMFDVVQISKCFDFWQNENNYLKYK